MAGIWLPLPKLFRRSCALVVVAALCAQIFQARALAELDCLDPLPGCVSSLPDAVHQLWMTEDEPTRAFLIQYLSDNFTFAQLIRTLRAGPDYSEDVPTGWLRAERFNQEGTRFPYSAHVPLSYSSDQPYALNIYLHGYTARRASALLEYAWPASVISENAISLFPEAWTDELWWQDNQTENLRALIRLLKQTYNIDENRIFLHGISDGGSGTWHQATVDSMLYAGFVPVIGNPNVNSDPQNELERDYYPLNLTNRPFLVVNTEQDPVYPGEQMNQVMNPLRALGVDLEFVLVPDAGHETGWLESFLPQIEAFREANPRDSSPDQLMWRASGAGFADRFHWVRIDAVKPVPEGANLESANPIVVQTGEHIFPRTVESGRLMAMRENNSIRIASEGVDRVTLLLSPDDFDFSRPIRVIQNDRLIFAGRVSPDKEVMLKWAAADLDRTTLYAGELRLTLDVPPAVNRSQNLSALGGPSGRVGATEEREL